MSNRTEPEVAFTIGLCLGVIITLIAAVVLSSFLIADTIEDTHRQDACVNAGYPLGVYEKFERTDRIVGSGEARLLACKDVQIINGINVEIVKWVAYPEHKEGAK